MDGYFHKTLLVNGRSVELNDIARGNVNPLSNFESSLFTFVQEWMSGKTSFIQQTSGSTGVPKNIEIARAHMLASAAMTRDALQLRAGETALLCLDPTYIAGKMMLVRSFLVDLKIIAVEPSSNPFIHIADDTVIDFAALVPLQIHNIMHSQQAGRLDTTRNIIVGGAPLSNGVATELSHFKGNIYSTYGMTETVSHVALWHVNKKQSSQRFYPLPGVKLNLDDRGCLVLNVPFLPSPVITNDLVELYDDGSFEWLGRADNIINTGGIKVIPEKLEKTIGDQFKIVGIDNRFMIAGLPDEILGSKIVLLIEGLLDISVKQKLHAAIDVIVDRYERPKEIFDGVSFIFTENGKIDRPGTLSQIGN